jgi:outer membrane protein assembly factor BamD
MEDVMIPRACAVAAVSIALAGCGVFGADARDRTLKMTPEQLYAEARGEIASARYGEAIKLLGTLESRYPFGAWAQQAQIDTAFAHYRDGDRTQALVSVERFIRLHPTSPFLDYAYYLKGLINFNEEQGLLARFGRQDLSERDQRASREAFEAFREVATRFPDSKYAEDSIARMQYLLNAMAAGEVHIARYYFSRGAYVAAANRAQDVIRNFEQTPAVEDALVLLMNSYERLGLESLRADTERILQRNFPNRNAGRGTGRAEVSNASDGQRWWRFWR